MSPSARKLLAPLALAQFICSFAGSNMNVMINDITNLGSSFGTAIAGTILVSDLASGNGTYVVAMVVLAGLALAGLVAALMLPHVESR
jgi:hypothetical protein